MKSNKNINYEETLYKNMYWLNRNNLKNLENYADDFEEDKIEYLGYLIIYDIAFELLERNGFFEQIDFNEFIESNDALFAVSEFMFWLDDYDLPRILVGLLPLELYVKAINYLENVLMDEGLIDEYYDILK